MRLHVRLPSNPAYTTKVVCADGGVVQLASRERPQLLLRNGTPAVLYNAVAEGRAEGGKDFTLAQALGDPEEE